MTLAIDRTVKWRKGLVRAAGKPRSEVYALHDVRAYAVTLDYFPAEDRLRVGYSIGNPLIPEPWLVAEEDPLEGLWLDPRVPAGYLLQDVPIARKFLNPMRREGAERTAEEAVDRFIQMLRELDSLI